MKAKTADRTPEIHEQYKKSHNSYGISEKINRNYDGFDAEKIYGESTGIVFIKIDTYHLIWSALPDASRLFTASCEIRT